MSNALTELISRMKLVVNDPDTKPLWLHWSDIETLLAVQLALENDNARIQRLRQTVGDALDVALAGAGR